jgi:hypothetical protein
VTPLYPKKLALTSPTGGGCSIEQSKTLTKLVVGIVASALLSGIYYNRRGANDNDALKTSKSK